MFTVKIYAELFVQVDSPPLIVRSNTLILGGVVKWHHTVLFTFMR